MKNTLLISLLLLLSLCTLLLASCGKEPEKTDATITFSVDGEETVIRVPFGKVIEYNGKTMWEDDEALCTLVGWDKPLDGVFEDTVFTAVVDKQYKQSYTIRWQTREQTYTTTVPRGHLPEPPAIMTSFDDVSGIYTFRSWGTEIVPATADTLYRAEYDTVVKQYDITFRVNGEVVATKSTPYGTMPEPPAVSLPEGCSNVSWGLETVSGKATYDARFVHVDSKVSDIAVKAATTGSVGERASGALFLGLQERQYPGTYTDEIVDYLRWVTTGGNEPDFDFTPNMRNPMISGAIAVAKTIPGVWSRLSAKEVEKLDYLMASFAVQAALATDDSNKYTTGPGWNGNYKKDWNPNYPLSNVTQIIFATHYFGGADATNQLLKDFDYDTYIAKFKEWGWTNALAVWGEDYDPINQTITYVIATEPKNSENKNLLGVAKILTDDGNGHFTLEVTTSTEDIAAQEYGKLSTGFVAGEKRVINYTSPRAMMMTGGDVYTLKCLYRISQYCGKAGGTGLGVPAIGEKGYTYKGNTLSNLEGIWNSLLNYNYSGGACTSKAVLKNDQYLCFIADDTRSPLEGIEGMMKEFNAGDRSSLSYCNHDFNMCTSTTAAMIALGMYNPYSASNLAISEKVWVGNTDYLYKALHGYASYSGTAVRGDPTVARGSGTHYEIWKYVWLEGEGQHFNLDYFLNPSSNGKVYNKTKLYYSKENSSRDMTVNVGGKAADAETAKNYWENDLFLSFTLNYAPNTLSSFEIRLRSKGNDSNSACRGNAISYANGKLTPVNVVGTATPVTLSDYGWHRITVQLHQGAVANEISQSVDYSFTMTIYVDGAKAGEYELNADTYVTKHWCLFEATYDETEPDHLLYAKSADNPYVQFFKSGIYNGDTSKQWFLLLADDVTTCAPAPEVIAPVTYELNGGAFADDYTVECADGYTPSYTTNEVPYFVAENQFFNIPAPVRVGYTFAGWFVNSDFSGDEVTALTTSDGSSIILYAKWTPAS